MASSSRDASEPTGRAPSRTIRDRGSGPKVGRYHVLEPLGEGGMARVFLASDPQLHRRVAIKLLETKEGANQSSARLVRERRYGRALALAPDPAKRFAASSTSRPAR